MGFLAWTSSLLVEVHLPPCKYDTGPLEKVRNGEAACCLRENKRQRLEGRRLRERNAISLPMAVAIESPIWRADRHADMLRAADFAITVLEPVGTREFVGSNVTLERIPHKFRVSSGVNGPFAGLSSLKRRHVVEQSARSGSRRRPRRRSRLILPSARSLRECRARSYR